MKKFAYLLVITAILGLIAGIIGKYSAAKSDTVKEIVYWFMFIFLMNNALMWFSNFDIIKKHFNLILVVEGFIFGCLFFSIYGSASNCIRHLC